MVNNYSYLKINGPLATCFYVQSKYMKKWTCDWSETILGLNLEQISDQ